MFREEDLLPLSALQHYVYCARRAALVHLEGLWADNAATVQGALVHERAHGGGVESRGDVRTVRGLAARSLHLGVFGILDVLEFHRVADDSAPDEETVALEGAPGRWRPHPVEYKRGRMREEDAYRVQVCAQAICVEEMMGVRIQKGSIYFSGSSHRMEVVFDEGLRARTEEAATALRALFAASVTPTARYGPKCRECSLRQACLPQVTNRRSARAYLATLVVKEEP